MMNDCAAVESLLFLFREGELTAEERSALRVHLEGCTRCRALLADLRSMDAALEPARRSEPAAAADPGCVDETLRRIAPGRADESSAPLSHALWGWLQPGMAVVLLVLAIMFTVQQSRDAMRLSELEERIRATGARQGEGTVLRELGDRIRRVASGDIGRSVLQSPLLAGAAPGSDLLGLFSPSVRQRLEGESGLFDRLSIRYPHLAAVDPDDGIDEREREILATEGRALMNDITQLLQEGGRRQ